VCGLVALVILVVSLTDPLSWYYNQYY